MAHYIKWLVLPLSTVALTRLKMFTKNINYKYVSIFYDNDHWLGKVKTNCGLKMALFKQLLCLYQHSFTDHLLTDTFRNASMTKAMASVNFWWTCVFWKTWRCTHEVLNSRIMTIKNHQKCQNFPQPNFPL